MDATSPDPPRTVFVVLPAYDEAAGLPNVLSALRDVMSAHAVVYRVIVVDDGSGDATPQVAAQFASLMPLTLIRHPVNRGLGAALSDGFDSALEHARNTDIIVTMDADDTHPPAAIAAMVAMIDGGCDVVIASRYRAGARVVGVPAGRRLLSRGASWLMRIAIPTRGVRDFTCGFRAYRAAALRRALAHHGGILTEEDGFQCMVDILVRLRALGLAFGEVPLQLRYDRKRGPSKIALARTTWNTLRLLVRPHVKREA
jgi:dolichol-phosphate mannosyltransferase